ncbi:MAG: DUF84 family protein [Desulfurococcales archaeon]|nr:DUF84 family protein [Desulfurococcales archaeon]
MQGKICGYKARVAVATKNSVKLRAVEKAFKRYCNVNSVVSVDPPPISKQPHGALDVVAGALARAERAYSEGDFGVGIEAGPIEFYASHGYIETQIAVVIGPGNRVSVGLSPSFEVPQMVVDGMLDGVELAELVPVKRRGDIGEGVGYIGIVTRGYITRQDLTEAAVVMALAPWIGGFHYELQTIEELKRKVLYSTR